MTTPYDIPTMADRQRWEDHAREQAVLVAARRRALASGLVREDDYHWGSGHSRWDGTVVGLENGVWWWGDGRAAYPCASETEALTAACDWRDLVLA